MKEKLRAFFSKKQDYYSPEEEEVFLTPERELKKLRKENKKLKEEFFDSMQDSIKTRRSVRSFSSQPIDEKKIYDCITAALNSPAAGNIQNYRIILVKDIERRKQIGKIALNQVWMCDAPIIAIIVRNDVQINQMYPQHGQRYSLQNSSAFISTFLNLIHASGYASCWVEACEEVVLKEYLGIPMEQHIDAILPIGFPMDIPKVEKSPYEDMIFFENYGNNKK